MELKVLNSIPNKMPVRNSETSERVWKKTSKFCEIVFVSSCAYLKRYAVFLNPTFTHSFCRRDSFEK